MRATIVAARVLAAVLLLWAVVSFVWTIKMLLAGNLTAPGSIYTFILNTEVYFHHFAVPLIGAAVAVGLLLLASILDELRRRPQ